MSSLSTATEEVTSANKLPLVKQLRYRLAEFPEGVAFFTLALLFVFFAITAENFLGGLALSNVLTYASINGMMVVGVATLMIAGEFDLSVGSTFAVASYVFAITMNDGVAPLLALGLALAASVLLGMINGWLVNQWGIPSFIATLGTLLAYRGIARYIGEGYFVYFEGESTPALFTIMNGSLSSINNNFTPVANFRTSTIWFVLVGIFMSIILLRTRFGNRIYATGGNPGAALAQGVNTKRIKLYAFMLSGFFAGLAGVIQFAQRQSVDPLRGEGLELIAVAATVIGGVRLQGGFGNVMGAAFGAILLSMLEQGLVLLEVPLQIFRAIAGTIVILSVIVSNYIQSEQ